MTNCQKATKESEQTASIKHNGKYDQAIELSAISGDKNCNASRDDINSSSPVITNNSNIGRSINNG